MAKLILSMIAVALCAGIALGQSCGVSSTVRANRPHADGQRIVGGVECRPRSHTWLVSMQQYGSHFCGGSLLRVHPTRQESDMVLTAAHCVYDGTSGLTVSAGAHDLEDSDDARWAQTVKGSKTSYHSLYNPDTTMNDIAVVKLATPIKFNANITPACLPTGPNDRVDTTPKEGTVAGWGLTREGGSSVSAVCNQVGVPTIDNANCNSNYRSQGISIDKNAMMCAGYARGGKDSCQGDSGGPFVFKVGNSWVQHGVVSFGVGCARAGLPGVYARVANYLPWIQSKITEMSSIAG